MGLPSKAQDLEKVIVLDTAVRDNPSEVVQVVVELRWMDLQALDELQSTWLERRGSQPSRSDVVRQAVQFYREKQQEVII